MTFLTLRFHRLHMLSRMLVVLTGLLLATFVSTKISQSSRRIGGDGLSGDRSQRQICQPLEVGSLTGEFHVAAIAARDTMPAGSIDVALDRARRQISELTLEQAALSLNEGVTHFAWNPGQDFSARFESTGGVRFDSGAQPAWRVGFSYSGASSVSHLAVEGTRAEFLHADGVREWFDNQPAGIEHGFILGRRPKQGVHLEISLEGMTAICQGGVGSDLLLQDGEGNPQLRYSGLKAWDSDGKDLLALIEPSPSGFVITVDDGGAKYPLTIDPLITVVSQELGPIVTGSGSKDDNFGNSVAFDGDTAMVGAPQDRNAAGGYAGNVYVFTRVAGGEREQWSLQGKLGYGGNASGDCFGAAVAFRGDTAVVGVPYDGEPNQIYPGSVRVWVRNGEEWRQQAKIERTGATFPELDFANLGWHVGLSGETLVLGIPDVNMVLVYSRVGDQWALQQRINGPFGVSAFGSVSIEGDSLAVGAKGASGTTGSVHYYTRSNGVWSGFALPKPADVSADDNYGAAVQLSGSSLFVGAPGEEGAVYVFQKVGQTWGTPARLSPVPLGRGRYRFGATLAVDGDLALIGAPDAYDYEGGGQTGIGIVFAARRSGPTWQLTEAIHDPGVRDVPRFGSGLALRGTRALVGASWRVTKGGSVTGDATFFDFQSERWVAGAALEMGDDGEGSAYGRAVAVDGDTLAIAAGNESNADGHRHEVIHVFNRSGGGWTHQCRLGSPSESDTPAGFGSSLDISGGTLVVGEPLRENAQSANEDGVVYIFELEDDMWRLAAKLEGAGQFGTSVAVEDNIAVVGSPEYSSESETSPGAVFTYQRDAAGWMESGVLEDPSPTPDSGFGCSVALDGDTLLAGAPLALESLGAEGNYGRTLVFRRQGTGWQLEAKLVNQLTDGHFGASVALSGDNAVISAPSDKSSYQFFSRRNGIWRAGDIRFLKGGPSIAGNQVAISANVAAIASYSGRASGECELLEFMDGHWQRRYYSPASGGVVALDSDTLVTGNPDAYTVSSVEPDIEIRRGRVLVHDLERAEGYFLQVFDSNQDRQLNWGEWLAIYQGGVSRRASETFDFIDRDGNGAVSRSELALGAKGGRGRSAAAASTLLSRAGTFLDLDGSAYNGVKDSMVDRAEFGMMWKPGTPVGVIDAAWNRAEIAAGFDLRQWLMARTLPSVQTYHLARKIRAHRLALATRLDRDIDGSIQRTEFDLLLRGQPAKPSKIDAAWKVLTGWREGRPLVGEITIQAFLEVPKLPMTLRDK